MNKVNRILRVFKIVIITCFMLWAFLMASYLIIND